MLWPRCSFGPWAVEAIHDHPDERHREHTACESGHGPDRPPKTVCYDTRGRNGGDCERKSLRFRRRGRGEEDPGEKEHGRRAARQPKEHAKESEGGERGKDGVGVVRRAVDDQGRRACQDERHRSRDERRHGEPKHRPCRKAEGHESDRRFDVDQGRVEASYRLRGQCFQRRQQHGVLRMLYRVRRRAEDRPPNVAIDKQRVGLRPPHRPTVPLCESAGDGESKDPSRQDGQRTKTAEFDHAREALRSGSRQRPEGRARSAPDQSCREERPNDEGTRREEPDMDPNHRSKARGKPARRDAYRWRDTCDRRQTTAPRRNPCEEHDGRTDGGEASIEREETSEVAHDVRCPSQTPSTSPSSSNSSRTDGEGSPNTITASAFAKSSVATAG